MLVTRVIDGDTIDVSTVGRVRLLGIDAPEVGHGFDTAAPFGREARDRLTSMVLHRWVRLEHEGPAVDSYNRHLAYVMREDGLFVNAALVRDGLARVTARLPLARLDELKRAEAEAQRAPPRDVGQRAAGFRRRGILAPPAPRDPRRPRARTASQHQQRRRRRQTKT